MGYLFLAIALFAGAAKGYCGKRTSGYVAAYSDAMLVSAIRMAFCIAIGLCAVAAAGQIGMLAAGRSVLLISLLSGVGNAAFVVLWLVAVKRGAYMMLDVFCMLGVLIPIIGCAVFFQEPIRWNHIVGAPILLAAALMMCSYSNSIKEKLSPSSVLLLLLCGCANGVSDFSQKMFVRFSENTPNAVFQFYTYLFSEIILLVCFGFSKRKGNEKEKKPFPFRAMIGYIAVMSVCLFVYSYFKTKAAAYLPSAELYPLAQGGALILSTVMAATLFRERLRKEAVIGMAMSFAALLVINLL